MKKIISFLYLSLFCSIVFGQTQNMKEALLTKSKKQKTTAWVLLGTGSTLIITGIIFNSSHKEGTLDENIAGGFIIAAGIASTVVSIPFFISAGNRKKQAAALSFGKQQILTPINNAFCFKTQPAIALKISLGR